MPLYNQGSTPLGTISEYGGSSAPNAQWLMCDGSAVSRTTYAGLFAILSTTYGVGDGSTTFNLPDLRGRVPVGLNATGPSLINTLGDNEGVALANRNISHHHNYDKVAGNTPSGPGGTQNFTSVTSTDSTGDANNQDNPAFLVVNYIIRALN